MTVTIEKREVDQDIKRLEIWTDVNGVDVRVVAFGDKNGEWYLNLLKDAVLAFNEREVAEERGIILNWDTGADLMTRPIRGKFAE